LEKELFRNTLRQTRHRGCNSTVMLSVAKARLSMPEAVSDLRDCYQPLAQPNGMFYWPMHGYYPAESVGIAAGISEQPRRGGASLALNLPTFPTWRK
jgi:hypothetical protein